MMLDSRRSAMVPDSLLSRIVACVDDGPESFFAARQAGALQGEGGSLHLVGAAEVAKAVHAGFAAPDLARQMLVAADFGLRRAGKELPWATTLLVKGEPASVLLSAADNYRATLVAVGVSRLGRAAGIMLGTVSSRVLRDARCSVLVARAAPDRELRPRRMVVGVDGSPRSVAAADVAAALAKRFDADLTTITGLGGKRVDPQAVSAAFPTSNVVDVGPVDALVRASKSADLVVVGSRGLHGLTALGSVSERVAHRADCSVLVVRSPTEDSETMGRVGDDAA